MATNVLIIPEDFRKDQYLLKPIVEKMFVDMGVTARVQVCRDPLLGGVGEALKWDRIQEIIDRYRGMTRVFLLIVDRDCDENRRAKLDGIKEKADTYLQGTNSHFLVEDARQEVEVWLLAGISPLPKGWAWKGIRSECHPKEAYYDKLAAQRGLLSAPYEGRDKLAREAAGNYARIRKLCPEDVGALHDRVAAALGAPA